MAIHPDFLEYPNSTEFFVMVQDLERLPRPVQGLQRVDWLHRKKKNVCS